MSLLKQFIDIIYPPRCALCQEFLWKNRAQNEHDPLLFCQSCFRGFSEIASPHCTLCSRPFASESEEDHLCEDCLRKRPFYDALGAPYIYEGDAMRAIHQFKYEGKTHLVDSLGPLLTSFAKRWLKKTDGYLAMPVPLHTKRLRERGFNQSLLLARYLSHVLRTELDFLSLRRIRYTLPQIGLKSDERRKNVRKAFELTDRRVVKGRNILLVDDVATTGSTLNECSRVLKRAGAQKVLCLVLARTAGL